MLQALEQLPHMTRNRTPQTGDTQSSMYEQPRGMFVTPLPGPQAERLSPLRQPVTLLVG